MNEVDVLHIKNIHKVDKNIETMVRPHLYSYDIQYILTLLS